MYVKLAIFIITLLALSMDTPSVFGPFSYECTNSSQCPLNLICEAKYCVCPDYQYWAGDGIGCLSMSGLTHDGDEVNQIDEVRKPLLPFPIALTMLFIWPIVFFYLLLELIYQQPR